MKEYYQVKTIQEIPYASWDDEFGNFTATESTGKVEEQIAGTFPALHLAQIFAKALEQEIAEGAGFVVNCFTPTGKHSESRKTDHGSLDCKKEALMKISKNEYDELMSMLDFFSYKIDPCYKRETDAVAEKYRENFKKYIAKDYYPDAAHDISRREW